MGKRKLVTLLFLLLCGLLVAATAHASVTSDGYAINWDVIGGGAGPEMSGDGYTVNATLGQTAIGWSANGHQLSSGFWYGALAGCEQVVGVTISGPTTGVVDTSYTFNAAVEPPTATSPIVYDWSPAPDSGQGTSSASYVWATPGEKNLQVAVSNCGGTGTADDTHAVTVEARLYLPLVVRESS